MLLFIASADSTHWNVDMLLIIWQVSVPYLQHAVTTLASAVMECHQHAANSSKCWLHTLER